MTSTRSAALSFTFTMTQRDRYRVQRVLSQRSRWMRVFQAVCVLVAVMWVVLAIVGAHRLHQPASQGIATSAPWIVLMMLWAFALFPFTQWVAARRHMKMPLLRGDWTFELRSEGLTIRGPMTTTAVNWDAIQSAVETTEYVLFYYSKGCAYFLPKHAVPTPADMQAIRAMATAHLPGRVNWLNGSRSAVSA